MARISKAVTIWRLADLEFWLGPGMLRWRRDPRVWVRVVLGVLVLANLVAAAILLKPWGGSAEDLERQLATLRQEAVQRRQSVERLRGLTAKVETARKEAEQFVTAYFMDRRTASSTVVRELDEMAQKAGIKQKESSYLFEPVDGSETLNMMTINAGYEGTYADLVHFVNLLDRSPRLLIVSDLQAAPQQSGLTLNVTMKVNTFVRDEKAQP
ncbi:MAG: type 4a pilus biogenesis protein PilO [Acidobacteriota bacterium]